jgi:D-amino-acid dehydrogenase
MTPAPDVVVVGGGIAGTATAALLAEGGARVALVEADAIAAGASGRNSGVVQFPFDPVLVELHRATLAEYRALAAEAGPAFAFPDRPAGLLYLGDDEAGLRALAARLAIEAPEVEPRLLPAIEAARIVPGLGDRIAAISMAIGYPVAPDLATHAFIERGRGLGVEVRIGRAAELVRTGGRVTGVAVDGTVIQAGAVVVAAGPWTPDLVDPSGTWRPIRPVWGVVLDVGLADPPGVVLEEAAIATAIEPPARSPTVGASSPGSGAPEADPGARTADLGDLGFSLVTAAGRSSLGSTFLEERPDPAAWVDPIRRRAARFLPALERAEVRGVRVCARPVSLDGRPLVGRVPGLDGLFVHAGHGPWGISTGPGSARLVADLVLGRGDRIPPALDPGRFGPA